ncbi:hypothetical protein FRC08_013972 [Ceratobasidium sp. 394]|nr:hypothetical protein FRC08_013972 [Ceratobasidium sp. 394]
MRLCVKEEPEEPEAPEEESKEESKEEPKEKRRAKRKAKRKENYRGFSVREILSTIEFKWHYSPIKSELRSSYITERADPVPAIDVPTMNFSHGQNSQGFGNNSSVENVPPASGTPGNTSQGEASSNTLSSVPGSVSSSSHRSKRSLEGADPSNSQAKKAKVESTRNHKLKSDIENLMTQTALNARESLRCSLGRHHCLSLAVIDEYIWVWWIDRQGAIQSTGINFVCDLPRFLVLLLVLQHFTLADWGYNLELDPTIIGIHTRTILPEMPLPRIQLKIRPDFRVSLNPETILHRASGLVSRTTIVMEASRISSDAAGPNLVAKLYWPNKDRKNEYEIIEKARAFGGDLPNHLPRAFSFRDLGEDTGVIREELGIRDKSPRPPRVCRIIIFEALEPLTCLQGEEFLTAWIHCVRCHFVLWKKKIFHQDLSVKNLMVRRNGNTVLGILIDWDLSYTGDKQANNNDLTGTIPFLAIRVLQEKSKKRPFQQLA